MPKFGSADFFVTPEVNDVIQKGLTDKVYMKFSLEKFSC